LGCCIYLPGNFLTQKFRRQKRTEIPKVEVKAKKKKKKKKYFQMNRQQKVLHFFLLRHPLIGKK